MFAEYFARWRARNELLEQRAAQRAAEDLVAETRQRKLSRKRANTTVIGTCEYEGYRGDEKSPTETFFHIMVFRLNELTEHTITIEGDREWEYNEDMVRDRSNWVNLGRLPAKVTMADNDGAMRFKLFWGENATT